MDIVSLVVGSLATNCYLLTSGNDCVIIDPGSEADFISTTILENRLNPLAILLTHGHFDHCLAALELKLNFNLPIFVHKDDSFLYRTADKSANHWTGEKALKLPPPDHNLTDGQELEFNDLKLKIIHTPGHTPGSVCLLTDSALFTGDLLFAEGVGRTDFSYSDHKKLLSSLKKIRGLPDTLLIYPGHEEFGLPLYQILSGHLL